MTAGDRHTVVVDRHRLHAEFRHLRRALEDYGRFLADVNGDEAWPARAVPHLRAQHLALLQARVSLGSVELACALLRDVLGRLHLEQLRFRPHGGNGTTEPSPAAGGAPGAPAPLETLVAGLQRASATAPLELQERLQRLLACIVEFFSALGEESGERVEGALARVNLATANAQSRNLLREIAIVTRDIYTALQSVSEELPLDLLSESSGGISEAVQRLNSVVVRLDEAATQNLDHLEQVNRICDEEGESLRGVVEALRAGQRRLMELKAEHPALEAALSGVQARLSDEVGGPVMTLRHQLARAQEQHLQLISNQSFQELTGRTLKKIIDFVQALESQLYEILRQYRPAGVAPPEPGDHAPTEATAAAESSGSGASQSQDDVDKLLGELGF